jgi:hypothetical protein
MPRPTKSRFVVRIDPEVFRDVDFAERLSIEARATYFDSLFYLAQNAEPDGMYPHLEIGGRSALSVADELVRFGVWEDVALGYRVKPYLGCAIMPEQRVFIPDALRLKIYARDGYMCLTCGATDNLTLDHIIPWSKGGPDTEENLRTLCHSCNSRKGNRPQ